MRLYELGEDIALLREMLEDESGDPEAITDRLNALNTERSAKLMNIGLLTLELDGECEAIDAEIKRLQALKTRKRNHAERLKGYLLGSMQGGGDTRIHGPLIDIRRLKGRERVVVDDEGKILGGPYVRRRTIAEPDKELIKKALKAGHDVFGAHLEIGPETVSIR